MTPLYALYRKATTALVCISLLMLTACENSSRREAQSNPDSTNRDAKRGRITKRTQDGCYMRVSGKQMRDTQYVQLHIESGKVSGKLVENIYEKDARRGNLVGSIQKDKSIKAVWTYMQEGQTDTLTLSFLLTPKALMQRPLKVNTATGRQVTDNSASFSVELTPADCKY
ncbi:hypothetical protein [Mucilaginibacter sp. CSA2-8R]|uniref:hypothetical protein n=1 Tax=Mucilaginibacter sp. CSA2-8R TaxID=3141542 RepID=UPI00315D88C1